MDEQSVKAAGKRAIEFTRLIEDKSFRPAAFGVLFGRLLEPAVTELNATNFSSQGKPHKPVRPSRAGKHATKIGPHQRIRDLTGDGFFKEPKGLNETLKELQLRGHTYDQAVVGKSLLRLVHEKVLRRSRRKEGGREFYAYTEW